MHHIARPYNLRRLAGYGARLCAFDHPSKGMRRMIMLAARAWRVFLNGYEDFLSWTPSSKICPHDLLCRHFTELSANNGIEQRCEYDAGRKCQQQFDSSH